MEGAGSGVQGTLLQNAILGHIDLKLMECLPESVQDPPVRGSLPTPGGGSTLISKGKRTLGRPGTSRSCSAAPGSPRSPHTPRPVMIPRTVRSHQTRGSTASLGLRCLVRLPGPMKLQRDSPEGVRVSSVFAGVPLQPATDAARVRKPLAPVRRRGQVRSRSPGATRGTDAQLRGHRHLGSMSVSWTP